MSVRRYRGWLLRLRSRRRERVAALQRISETIGDYLYTNEHLPGGGRRSVYSGANREKLMGGAVPPGADVALEWERLIHPDDWQTHLEHRERLSNGEASDVVYRLCGYDGVTRWIHARTRPHCVGGRLFVDGMVMDVTARREAELALARAETELRRQLEVNAHQALHDPLTGLGNRRKLLNELETAFADPEIRARALLVICDLDGFKLYNDTFGHPAGDALLARFGRRLTETASAWGSAYRLGGDEFCVLVTRHADIDDVVASLCTALTERGEMFSVTCASGSALLREARHASEALLLADQRLYEQKGAGRETALTQLVDVLVAALEERDHHLSLHLDDVAEYASLVARELRLAPEQVDTLRHAARLHDIGKLAIPDEILHKPGALDDEEWGFIHQHTVIGERIISTAPALREAARIVRSSHERYDGTGYPDGLEAGGIPIQSRIIAVCDAFDAMIGPRPYRDGLAPREALVELRACAGTQFDPRVVTAFTSVLVDGSLPRVA